MGSLKQTLKEVKDERDGFVEASDVLNDKVDKLEADLDKERKGRAVSHDRAAAEIQKMQTAREDFTKRLEKNLNELCKTL